MIWLAAALPALVLAVVFTAWPYEAWRRAGRLARRSDGSISRPRRSVERSRRWRVVVRGAVLPVVLAAVVGGAGYALHAWAPWSATAAVFGTATPETDLVAQSLFDEVEARGRAAAEETANALPNRLRVPGRIGVRDWFFEHFPLHPLLVVFSGAAFWWLSRWVVAERVRYLRGLRSRMRAYQRHDLRRLQHRAENAAPPPAQRERGGGRPARL